MDCALRSVFYSNGGPKQSHYPITCHFVNCTTKVMDFMDENFEYLIHNAIYIFRSQLFRKRSKSNQVTKHYGYQLAFAFYFVFLVKYFIGQTFR